LNDGLEHPGGRWRAFSFYLWAAHLTPSRDSTTLVGLGIPATASRCLGSEVTTARIRPRAPSEAGSLADGPCVPDYARLTYLYSAPTALTVTFPRDVAGTLFGPSGSWL
jgi:hypothetical protein